MAVYSKFLSLISGIQTTVDLSANTLNVQALEIGGVLLSSAAGGNAGSKLVGDDNSYSHFTPSAATVKGALAGIDAALATSGATNYSDAVFYIFNTSDNTKHLAFDASAISTATTRTLKMANADVDLANLTNSNISASAAIAYSKLNLSASIVNADIANAAAIAYSKLNLALSIVNADISTSAAIAYSKLALTNSIVNADIASAAAIAYSKLNLSASIVNADIASAAAIAYNKLAALAGSTNSVLTQNSSGFVQASAILSTNLFLADGSVNATGNFNLNSHKLTSLSAGTTAGDSVRYEQAILTSGANAWAANQDLGGNLITGSGTPVNPNDLVPKSYVDNFINATSWKVAVLVATTANITLSGEQTIDGILTSASRVLVKNQSTASQNGIYVSAAGAWSRAADMNTWAQVPAAAVFVEEGTANADIGWVCTSQPGGTLGTTAINFVQFSSAGAYSADNVTLQLVSGVFSVKSGGISNTQVNAAAGIVYSKLTLTNSIVNADIASAAAIAYSKLALTNSIVLGDLTSNSVDENKIVSTAFSASGAISGGGGSKIAWLPDNSSLEISSDAARIKTTAYDQATITGGGGSAAAVQNAPQVKFTAVAGQSFTANTSYAVRWGVTANGETAGRVYAADQDTTSFNLFYVIGMASSGSAVSAGQNISVTRLGSFSLSSADTAFGSGTDGAPVFLTAAGAISTTAPSTAGQAVTRIGMVQVRSATAASNIVDVSPAVVGIN